jgi:hypothetical protein
MGMEVITEAEIGPERPANPAMVFNKHIFRNVGPKHRGKATRTAQLNIAWDVASKNGVPDPGKASGTWEAIQSKSDLFFLYHIDVALSSKCRLQRMTMSLWLGDS